MLARQAHNTGLPNTTTPVTPPLLTHHGSTKFTAHGQTAAQHSTAQRTGSRVNSARHSQRTAAKHPVQ